LPGINNSGFEHWQSVWERAHDNVHRIEQRDWMQPDCAEWTLSIERAVSAQAIPPILVAHSLGCLAAVRWMARSPMRLHGCLLVAVPDPSGVQFPHEAHGFTDLPHEIKQDRLMMVGSENDPYASQDFSRKWAARWRAEYVNLGHAGHINERTPLGEWPEGWALVAPWR
jgi:predicted alpha/beta hydrolase family esterase